jgi:N,N-dimethylformamidase beta subunit-like protein
MKSIIVKIVAILLVYQLAIGINSNSFYLFLQRRSYADDGIIDNNNVNNYNQTLHFNNKYYDQQFIKNTAIKNEHDITKSKLSAVNISSNEGNSEIPEEAMSGNNIYIAWIDDTSGNRDVFFRKSIDQGKTFGDTVNLSNMPGGAYNLQIIAIYNYVLVVWEHTPDNNGQVFFKRSVDYGNTFDKTVSLGNNTGFYGLPQISAAVSSNEEKNYNNSINSRINIYTIWHDSSNGIVLRKSIDGGETFDKAISLSKKYSLSFYPQLAVSSANVYATWVSTQNLDTKNETNNIVFSRSTDAGNTFNNMINLTNNAKLSFDPQISISNNHVYVTWLNGTSLGKSFPLLSDILFKNSNDFGATFDNSAISLNNYTGGWAEDPKIKAFDNKVYASWVEKSPMKKNGEIYFRQSIDNGKTFGDIINLSNNTKDSNSHQITLKQGNGNVYVIWVDDNFDKKLFNGSNISLRKITNNGNNSSIVGCTININNGIQYLPHSEIVIESSSDPQITVVDNNDKEEANIVWHDDSTPNDEILFKSIPISDNNAKHTTGTTAQPTSYQHCQDKEGEKIITASSFEQTSNQINKTFNNDTNNIALVEPSFTNAAYDNSYYIFYKLNANTSDNQNITKYLNLLTSKVDKSSIIAGSTLLSVRKNIEWLMPNYNIGLLTDIDVHDGSIFTEDNKLYNKFDVLILGHQEYVTQEEYNNLKRFVANGGVLILPYSNIFYSEVSYDKNSGSITLVKGHEWAFNGKSAWKSIKERWENETSQWVGSNYLCYSCNITFANNPFEYKHHEEQFITNPEVKILLDYNATISDHNNLQKVKSNNSDSENNKDPTKISKNLRIAAYEHDYKKGKVIALGIYPNGALMKDDRFNRFFDSILLKYTESLKKKETKIM